MLTARVCDPLGPLWTRAIGAAVTVVLGMLLAVASFVGWPFAPVAVTLFVTAVLFGAWTSRRRPAVRAATIGLGRTHIDVSGAGALSQRIKARDVLAARIAATSEGPSLALMRRYSRRRPVLLELRTDEELARVRHALRIGPSGFGVVAWPAAPRGELGAALASVQLTWFLLFSVGLVSAAWLGPLGAPFAAGPIAWALVVAWEALSAGSAWRVALSAHGVTVAEPRGRTTHTANTELLGADLRAETLVVRTAHGDVSFPARDWLPEERRCILAQITAAMALAGGPSPAAPALPGTLSFLERGRERSRDWLERLDAAASAMASPEVYRRPDVALGDLWSTLESPDAPPEVRAAAARVLARVTPEEAAERVSDVLASERDPRARDVIHMALEEDVEDAAAALDALAKR
jgi:hypothetical protein